MVVLNHNSGSEPNYIVIGLEPNYKKPLGLDSYAAAVPDNKSKF